MGPYDPILPVMQPDARRRLAWTMGIGFVFAILFGVTVRSFFVGLIVAMLTIVYVLPSLVVVWIVLRFVGPLRRWKPTAIVRPWVIPLFISLALSVIASAIVNGGLEWWDTRRAERYCDTLVGRLDAYRAQNGAYPDEDAFQVMVADDSRPMTVAGDSLGYWTNGAKFELRFAGRGFLDDHSFDSTTRQWMID